MCLWRAGACSSLQLESSESRLMRPQKITCPFVQASKLKLGLIKNEYGSLIITVTVMIFYLYFTHNYKFQLTYSRTLCTLFV